MGKIVKFCTSCDEGFAEKFAFCPNCASSLQSFEMNPVKAEAPPVVETTSAWAAADIVEPVPVKVEEVEAKAAPEVVETVDAIAEPVVEAPMAATPAAKAPAAPAFVYSTPIDVDRMPVSLEAEHNAYISEGEFYVTVIEEKNVGQRNALLLGTLGLMVIALLAGTVVSLFIKDLNVGSINDDIFNAVIVDIEPMTLEQEQLQKKDKGGGGGGGGRDEEEETTQGDLADQAKTPTRPPDAKVFRSDNFELKTPVPQTEGDRKFEKKFDRWGDPNGRFASFSNGTGTGGGQGSGTGTGQGSGRGTGAGSGDGSGSGSGLGGGNGNGTGTGGSDGGPPPPPAKPVGVTTGLKIISKPRPGYTDAARQNNIQGTVILRVTFLASGQVGSISAVKGLPNGLTEQAIAAARRISFEPAKRDGQGQAVTKQIEYSFSIY